MERDMNENYVEFPEGGDKVIVVNMGTAVLVAPVDTPPPSDGDLSGWTEIGYTTDNGERS
jgi:hypothetical protein